VKGKRTRKIKNKRDKDKKDKDKTLEAYLQTTTRVIPSTYNEKLISMDFIPKNQLFFLWINLRFKTLGSRP